jgi:inner membrane protein
MDPVTHLASGVIGAQAFRWNFPKARLFMPFCILCAWIPDVDILFFNADPEWSLLHHRGLSTSIAGGAVMAVILAILYRFVARKVPLAKSFLLALFLIYVHIWLDYITSYGTQILAPFSNERFSLDALFIIDPIYTITLLLFMVVAFIRKNKESVIGKWALAFVFIYPLASLGTGSLLENMMSKQYANQGIQFEEFDFIPDAFTPIYWKVVSRQKDTYTLTLVNTFVPGKEYPSISGHRANPGLLEELGTQTSMFATWKWFARYPIIKTRDTGNGTEMIFDDLRFSSVHPVMTSIFTERKPPFRLVGTVDDQGRLKSWQFNHSLRKTLEEAVQ